MMVSIHRSFQRGRKLITVLEQIDSGSGQYRVTFHEYTTTVAGRLMLVDIRAFDTLEAAIAHYDNERLIMDEELHALA
ncbi:hypothetical protein JCM19235_1285 [Vibrio maritimus]|uniref:Uncharacterized protein n=1 Tax=Vibrio maritimus TaxID=990268 RepID=A0A090S919_9VIBR|nr:hypothetical protein JCM19235_1285 [Vibrio maritimus]